MLEVGPLLACETGNRETNGCWDATQAGSYISNCSLRRYRLESTRKALPKSSVTCDRNRPTCTCNHRGSHRSPPPLQLRWSRPCPRYANPPPASPPVLHRPAKHKHAHGHQRVHVPVRDRRRVRGGHVPRVLLPVAALLRCRPAISDKCYCSRHQRRGGGSPERSLRRGGRLIKR